MQARNLAIMYSKTICFCSPHNQTSQSIFFNSTIPLPLTLIPTSFLRNLQDLSHTKTLFDLLNCKNGNFYFHAVFEKFTLERWSAFSAPLLASLMSIAD